MAFPGRSIRLSMKAGSIMRFDFIAARSLSKKNETPKGRKPYTLVNLPLYYAGRLTRLSSTPQTVHPAFALAFLLLRRAKHRIA